MIYTSVFLNAVRDNGGAMYWRRTYDSSTPVTLLTDRAKEAMALLDAGRGDEYDFVIPQVGRLLTIDDSGAANEGLGNRATRLYLLDAEWS